MLPTHLLIILLQLGRVGELATRFTFQEQQVNIAIIIRHGRLLAMEESRRSRQ